MLEQPLGLKFVILALANTDERVKEGKTVSTVLLFASLLWHQVVEKWNAYRASGELPIPALHLATDDVLESSTEKLTLQRKMGTDMRDIRAGGPCWPTPGGKSRLS